VNYSTIRFLSHDKELLNSIWLIKCCQVSKPNKSKCRFWRELTFDNPSQDLFGQFHVMWNSGYGSVDHSYVGLVLLEHLIYVIHSQAISQIICGTLIIEQ